MPNTIVQSKSKKTHLNNNRYTTFIFKPNKRPPKEQSTLVRENLVQVSETLLGFLKDKFITAVLEKDGSSISFPICNSILQEDPDGWDTCKQNLQALAL